jgi:hypothetical protein
VLTADAPRARHGLEAAIYYFVKQRREHGVVYKCSPNLCRKGARAQMERARHSTSPGGNSRLYRARRPFAGLHRFCGASLRDEFRFARGCGCSLGFGARRRAPSACRDSHRQAGRSALAACSQVPR